MAGPLKNARHERFAQEVFRGATADAAYATAGFKPARQNAARLMTKDDIRARILELKAEVAEEVVKSVAIDAAWVLSKASELYDKALEAKALSVAKGALDLIGKHVSVQAFRDQVNHTGLIEYKNLSDEEIEARIAAHQVGNGQRPTAH